MEVTEYGKARVTVFPLTHFLGKLLSAKIPKEKEYKAEKKVVITHYL